MDKKNTIIGVLLIVAAFAAMTLAPKPTPPPAPAPAAASIPDASAAPASSLPPEAPGSAVATATAPVSNVTNAAFAAVARDDSAATVTTLANSYIEVRFTDFGGAIRDVAFLQRDHRGQLVYPADLGSKDPFVFNALHSDPMLAFVDYPGLDRHVRFERVSQSATEVVYRTVLDGKLEVTRRYTLAPDAGKDTEPYQLRHETTFRNLTAQTAPLPRVALNIGTAAPTNARDLGVQITSGYSTGKDQTFISRRQLEGGSGMFGIGASEQKPSIVSPGPTAWTIVSNQFFTTVLTPDEPAGGLVTRRVKLLPTLPDADHSAYGLTAATQFDLKPLAANGTTKIGANFYVGPKEYHRLSNRVVFQADQDKVMQYGMWKWFSALLVTLMGWMHGLVPNWGVAIILTTLSLKLVFLPLTIKASRSMRRMAKLQPLMVALREKYKDSPQKQQAAMMELYKEHKVNPVGGCLPMLLPMPFFLGFYSMLPSTAELRFSPFLWAHDLSMPDTVWHIPYLGLPLNIMPLLLCVTMFFQMRLTPQPTVDNAQATMMKFMPFVFTLICYGLPCSLSLYSTTNGVFTIFQQMIINRMKDDGDPTNAPAVSRSSGGKPLKNVTPSKKK